MVLFSKIVQHGGDTQTADYFCDEFFFIFEVFMGNHSSKTCGFCYNFDARPKHCCNGAMRCANKKKP